MLGAYNNQDVPQAITRTPSNENASAVRMPVHGIIVVEGPNDVIALDAMAWPAAGLCSNRMAEAQADKIERFANRIADGKVLLMLDCQPESDEGAKLAAWELLQRKRLSVRRGRRKCVEEDLPGVSQNR